ncbi:hypothetical protein Tco_0333507 [Tanacetum coccineum]
MDEVNIDDLTIKQYLQLMQENQVPSVGIKVDDMTIAEYLEYEETMKIQDYDGYQPRPTKVSVSVRHRDHLSPRHKNHDPLLDAKTNPYFQASLSSIHPKTTKTLTKHTKESKERGNEGLGDWFEAEQEHEVSECKMVHTMKIDTHKKEAIQIERISSLPEKLNPGSFTIPCSVDIFNINVIADLGASINIMFKSALEELSLAEPKNANMIVEIADKTRCVPQGIFENVLDNQSQDELRGISDNKLKHYWKSTNDNDRMDLEWEGLSCTNWLGGQTREKTMTEKQEDPKKYGETKTKAIIGAMVNKLPEEWFQRLAKIRGIKSLREDGDNLKDFCQISNLEAMLREFLVLILLFPFYFISLMYNRDIVQIKWGDGSLILINRGLIQAIPTSLPPQPIGEATKASNLRRIPPEIIMSLLDLSRTGRIYDSIPSVGTDQALTGLRTYHSIYLKISPSEEQVATEPHSPVLNENTNELIQEDDVEFDGCVFYNPPQTPVFKEAESSSTYQYPSDMHEFHQQHRSTDKWTKNHLIEQMIGDRSKPVMTRKRHQTDAEVCMYAMTVSTIELKNIKEAMLDHS